MAVSPQTEDGYTMLANELFDAIGKAKLTHAQQSVLLAIIRKTYGFKKKEDDISASQIGEWCGMARTHVTSTLNELARMNVITKRPGVYGSIIGVQKDYSKWEITGRLSSTKSVQVYEIGTSTESVQGVQISGVTSTKSVQVDSTESVHTKENLPKETKQKKEGKQKTLAAFISDCESGGEKPIPENDSIFDYAKEIGLPDYFLHLNWLEFKIAYTIGRSKAKKYIDWRAVFRDSVRRNWYKVWYIDAQGNYALTTTGQQAQRIHKAAA